MWTAPHDGLVRIAGSVRVEPGGAAATVAIRRGAGELWPAHAIAVDAHALTARVAAGDEIAFVAARVGDAAIERVAWDPEITYLPER